MQGVAISTPTNVGQAHLLLNHFYLGVKLGPVRIGWKPGVANGSEGHVHDNFVHDPAVGAERKVPSSRFRFSTIHEEEGEALPGKRHSPKLPASPSDQSRANATASDLWFGRRLSCLGLPLRQTTNAGLSTPPSASHKRRGA